MTKLVLALFLCSVEVLYKDNVAAIVALAGNTGPANLYNAVCTERAQYMISAQYGVYEA